LPYFRQNLGPLLGLQKGERAGRMAGAQATQWVAAFS
jgi:hypothetical protein